MFPLWSGRFALKQKRRQKYKHKKLQILKKRSSPKHNRDYQNFAQTVPDFFSKCAIEGASLFISPFRKLEAGMTVEAAVVLPLFLFFFLNLGCAIELIRLHGNLQFALCDIGNRMAVYGYAFSEMEKQAGIKQAEEETSGEEQKNVLLSELGDVVFSYTYVKNQIAEYLGRQYLEEAPIVNGVDGLQFWESDIFDGNDCFEVIVTYRVEPFSSIIGFGSFRMANRYYGHLWNGYHIPGTDAGNDKAEKDVVYIAENGDVYHEDRNCSYLVLSIREVSLQEAHASRNSNGERYEMCMLCEKAGLQGKVYITEDGENIHYKRDCAGLKRTVYEVSRAEARGYPPCSRCGKSGE